MILGRFTFWISLSLRTNTTYEQQRVEYAVSLLIYKCLHQAAASQLAEMCVPVSATDNRCHLRSATHGDLPDWQDTEEVCLCLLVRCCGTHYH